MQGGGGVALIEDSPAWPAKLPQGEELSLQSVTCSRRDREAVFSAWIRTVPRCVGAGGQRDPSQPDRPGVEHKEPCDGRRGRGGRRMRLGGGQEPGKLQEVETTAASKGLGASHMGQRAGLVTASGRAELTSNVHFFSISLLIKSTDLQARRGGKEMVFQKHQQGKSKSLRSSICVTLVTFVSHLVPGLEQQQGQLQVLRPAPPASACYPSCEALGTSLNSLSCSCSMKQG